MVDQQLAAKTLQLSLREFLNPIFARKVLSPSKTIGLRGSLTRIQNVAHSMFGPEWQSKTVRDFVMHEDYARFFHRENSLPNCGKLTQTVFAELLTQCGLAHHVSPSFQLPDREHFSELALDVIQLAKNHQ